MAQPSGRKLAVDRWRIASFVDAETLVGLPKARLVNKRVI
jgi:hypothetical protein